MTKRFFATLLVAVILLVNLTPANVFAASNNPYCRISFDSSVGCNTIKYYYYIENTARYDQTRLVKFYDEKVLLGSNNTVITSNHKLGSNPAWTTDGKYLVWVEDDFTLNAREYCSDTNITLANGVSSLGLNSESMVETVTLIDNSSSDISKLLPQQTSPTAQPTVVPTVIPTATPPVAPTETPKATKKPKIYKSDKCENFAKKSVLYKKGTSDKYILKYKNKKLYLNGKVVARGIKYKKNILGFYSKNYLIYVKGHKTYLSDIKNPKIRILAKQNVKSLVYDKKTGFATSIHRLTKKLDYVENSKLKSILYQNGKKAHVLKTNKKRTKLYLDDKLLKELSQEEIISGVKFKKLGFTEDGYLCYAIKSNMYRIRLSCLTLTESWHKKKEISQNYLGFSKK